MNIYEDNKFDTAYDHPPTLTIKDHVHVGVEVRFSKLFLLKKGFQIDAS